MELLILVEVAVVKEIIFPREEVGMVALEL
jgi:hypothetical protein